ncbi:hypothetical protein U1Q18_018593, partial [Sarracenia purpurea var. burkii]
IIVRESVMHAPTKGRERLYRDLELQESPGEQVKRQTTPPAIAADMIDEEKPNPKGGERKR